MLACSRDIHYLSLLSCVSRIFYIHLCLFQYSGHHRWLERCAWECNGRGKIACWRIWWCSFSHWHWWDCSKKRLLYRVGSKCCTYHISTLLSDFFQTRGLRSILHPLLLHWHSFYIHLCMCVPVRVCVCMFLCMCVRVLIDI